MHFAGPAERARMSATGGEGVLDCLGPGVEASRRRMAASRESSSKGLRECFTFWVSIAVRVALTRGLICEGGGVVRLWGSGGVLVCGGGSRLVYRWR